MFVHGMKRVGGLKKGSFFSFELKKAGDQTTFVTQFLKTNSNEEVQLSQQPRRSSPLPNSSGTEKQTSRSEGGTCALPPLQLRERHKEETSRRPSLNLCHSPGWSGSRVAYRRRKQARGRNKSGAAATVHACGCFTISFYEV